MKKKLPRLIKSRGFEKTFLIMRIILFILIASFMQVSGAVFSQEKLDIVVQDKPVKEVFKEIEQNTAYRFFYSDDLIDLNKRVSINAREKSVEEILEAVSQQTGLKYKITEDNLVVIEPADVQQALMITGKVTSMMDETGLPGVNVVVKGTSTGTITDLDGSFKVEVPDANAVLVFSYVGYVTEEIQVNGRNVIDIVLAENIESLDEIVVTALNISREKKSLGYSVSEVKSEEFNIARENNVINSLSGRVAGLQITKAATGVDGSSRVVLRGISSILGGNRPLFVIDGIPMNAGYGGSGQWGGTDSGDALSDLNPEDIESMSVLKGAGAAAAYGSRGANGVILITTKNGSGKKGLGVSLNSSYTVENPMVLPKLQNKYGQGVFGTYPAVGGTPPLPARNDPWTWSYGPEMDGTVRTDWAGNESPYSPQENPLKEFLRTGSTFTNTVAVGSSNENSSFRASITNLNSKGLYPNNDMNKQTLNVRGTSNIKDIVELDAKITYIHNKVNNRPYLTESGANAGLSMTVMPRNIGVDDLRANTYNADGNEMTWTNDPTYNNMYWVLDNRANNDEKNRMQTMMSLKFNFLKRFSFLVRSGLDYSNRTFRETANEGSLTVASGRGSMSHSSGNNIEWNSDALLTYGNDAGDFIYDLSLGGNYRYDQWKGLNQSGNGMKIPDFFHISNFNEYGTGEWFGEKAVMSLYGLGQLAYKNFLYFDFTVRNDWSSTLPVGSNSYFYHSENLSFLFADAFNLTSKIFSSGKLRGSYAKVGNDTGPYQTQQYYSISQINVQYPVGSIGSQLAFFNYRPEITHSWELGTNLGFFDERLMFDFTYYESYSKDQIMNVPMLPSTGYGSKKMNAGEISNKGIEIQIDGLIMSRPGGFKWNVVLNYSRNKSKVVKLADGLEEIRLNTLWHADIMAYPGEEYGVIVGIDYKRDDQGRKLIDKFGFAQPGERKILGSINPDWMGGLSNVLSYKGIMFSFLIDAQMGSELYSWGKSYKGLYGTGEETLEGRAEFYATHFPSGAPLPGVDPDGYYESGISEGDGQPNAVPIDPAYRYYNLWNRTIAKESVLDGSNIRMREMVLGYTLPASLLDNTPLQSVSLAFTGRNLFFLYKNTMHIDPESGYSSGNTGNGFEHSSLPSTRSYGFNLRVSF